VRGKGTKLGKGCPKVRGKGLGEGEVGEMSVGLMSVSERPVGRRFAQGDKVSIFIVSWHCCLISR
jgi:hypothetical protein